MGLYAALTRILTPYANALKDIKTGYNGTVYNSPGAAVRGQISDLHNQIETNSVSADAVSFDDTSASTGYNNVQDVLEYALEGGGSATAADIQAIINIIEGGTS